MRSQEVNNKPRPLLATMATSCPAYTITYKKWALRLRCACVGGTYCRLREPTLCDQSCCMPLESDASAELGEAEITVPAGAESFGSQQAVGLAQMIARHTGTV